jgi:hypothetical protein
MTSHYLTRIGNHEFILYIYYEMIEANMWEFHIHPFILTVLAALKSLNKIMGVGADILRVTR